MYAVFKNFKTTNMKLPLIISISLTLLFVSCNNDSNTDKKQLKTGIWRAVLNIDEENPDLELPFGLELLGDSGNYSAKIINAEERIEIEEVKVINDSIFIKLPIFDSEIKAKFHDNNLTGKWFNYVKGDYSIPFQAVFGDKLRFHSQSDIVSSNEMNRKWQVWFGPKKEDSSYAIGEFKQKENIVTGTFLTETGDYRYLDGIIDGDKLYLSCFDGAHAFLFTADYTGDSLINGMFYSGKHHNEKWKAVKNDSLSLTDPYTLTFLKDPHSQFEFSIPDSEGNLLNFPGERFNDKVVIVQVMGTWCPNCMDETYLLADIYKEYKEKGLEIIGLAFEVTEDKAKIKRNIKSLKDKTGAKYGFLHAGKAKKEEASAKLPILNHIMSFPTTIIIDKKGKVRKIHTGFSGPGTGKHYEDFVKEFKELLGSLLVE